MQTVHILFNLAGGQTLPAEDDGPARRVQILMLSGLAVVVFAALWGLAAGSTETAMAVANLYKVPMVVLLSALCAVPAVLLTWKLIGAAYRATDLLLGLAAGNLAASLVLAVLAPVVALYYHTSGYLGGSLAMAACGLAVLVGLAVLLKTVYTRVAEARFLRVGLPLAVMVTIQLAALVQLIHVAAPIIPETTVFDGGMDTVLRP